MATSTAVPSIEPKVNPFPDRHTYIGGSEVYELLDLPQYGKGCSRALGYRKLGFTPDFPETTDPDLFERGNELEPIVAAKYQAETGRKVRALPSHVRRHPDYPFLGVHTDRAILAGHGGVTETGDLELKTHREGPYIRLLRDGIPVGHSLQVQHSLGITGHSWGAFAVLWPDGWKMKHFDVKRDEKAIDTIKGKGEAFWKLIANKELPAPLADADDARCKTCQFGATCRGNDYDEQLAAQAKADREGKIKLVTITNPALEAAIGYRELLAGEIKAAEEQKEMLDEQIKIAVGMSDTTAALVGPYKVYYKATSFPKIDVKLLAAKEPETAKKYTKTQDSHFYRIYNL